MVAITYPYWHPTYTKVLKIMWWNHRYQILFKDPKIQYKWIFVLIISCRCCQWRFAILVHLFFRKSSWYSTCVWVFKMMHVQEIYISRILQRKKHGYRPSISQVISLLHIRNTLTIFVFSEYIYLLYGIITKMNISRCNYTHYFLSKDKSNTVTSWSLFQRIYHSCHFWLG